MALPAARTSRTRLRHRTAGQYRRRQIKCSAARTLRASSALPHDRPYSRPAAGPTIASATTSLSSTTSKRIGILHNKHRQSASDPDPQAVGAMYRNRACDAQPRHEARTAAPSAQHSRIRYASAHAHRVHKMHASATTSSFLMRSRRTLPGRAVATARRSAYRHRLTRHWCLKPARCRCCGLLPYLQCDGGESSSAQRRALRARLLHQRQAATVNCSRWIAPRPAAARICPTAWSRSTWVPDFNPASLPSLRRTGLELRAVAGGENVRFGAVSMATRTP